jgi:hypothetical protein
MKKKFTTLAVVITMLISATTTFAQDFTEVASDAGDFKKFGLGLHVEQFRLNELMSSYFVPVNKIIFTFSPSNKFRLEPAIGYTKAKETNKDDFSTYETLQSGIFFGLGGFGMYQAGKTNLYFGIRLEYGTINDEYTSSDTYGNSYFQNNKTKRFMVGPAVGAEFFFSKHFSFGGEVALKNYTSNTERTDTNNPTPNTDDENKSNFFSTETGLLLRFYF